MRVCPRRDAICPHGDACPYTIDQYSCRAEDPDSREWLILKNGYFYRPNRSGYTQEKAAAGRYTRAEADREAAIEPESFTVLHESEIPDAPKVTDLHVELAAARRLIRDTHRTPVVHKDCSQPRCADCGAAEIETEQRVCTGPQTKISIRTMKLSGDREEHWVVVQFGDRSLDVRMYPGHQNNRAEYEAAEWRHLLLGEPRPNILDKVFRDKQGD
jgi:hypothetical protein